MSKNIKNRKMRLLNNMLWYRLFFHISFIYLLCEVGLDVLRIEIHVGRYMFCRKKSVGFPPNRITKKKCFVLFFLTQAVLCMPSQKHFSLLLGSIMNHLIFPILIKYTCIFVLYCLMDLLDLSLEVPPLIVLQTLEPHPISHHEL